MLNPPPDLFRVPRSGPGFAAAAFRVPRSLLNPPPDLFAFRVPPRDLFHVPRSFCVPLQADFEFFLF